MHTGYFKQLKRLFLIAFICLANVGFSQSDTTRFEQVRGLLDFYLYLLNTVGGESTPASYKETIFNESFSKGFGSAEVQIEDDLLKDRSVITNKNVVAYLRDVDFFFQDISFVFENIEISAQYKVDSSLYFLVSFDKKMNGTTIEGHAFDLTVQRFLEVNYDPLEDDLKIASSYTTKIKRDKELLAWWETLSFGWVSIFKEHVSFDSVTVPVIERVISMDSLNIAGNEMILNIEPLVAFRDLRYINISNTRVRDLTPLRHSTGITTLKASQTPITNIEVLSYHKSLREVAINNSRVRDIKVLAELPSVESLNLSNTSIAVFEPISHLVNLKGLDLSNTTFFQLAHIRSTNLKVLDVSQTHVTDIDPMAQLHSLEKLDISNNTILRLDALSNLPQLEELIIEGTLVASLSPLENLPVLHKISADNTPITEEDARAFMRKNPNMVVVTNGKELTEWWTALPPTWKSGLRPYLREEGTITGLVRLLNIEKLVVENKSVVSGAPLSRFKNLTYLDISNTQISKLNFISQLTLLKHLVANRIPCATLSGLEAHPQLAHIELRESRLATIEGLISIPNLSFIDIDNTPVAAQKNRQIELLLEKRDLAVIYRTNFLENWRKSLPSSWKTALSVESLNAQELHRLTQKSELNITGDRITNLDPLKVFFKLSSLSIDQSALTSLEGIQLHGKLKALAITNCPLQNIDAIQPMALTRLDISNTGVSSLDILQNMRSLKSLKCAGTQIKRLRAIEGLVNIEELDVSNTNIYRLDKLEAIRNLKRLSCYNTRLKQSEVDDFRKSKPKCEVVFY